MDFAELPEGIRVKLDEDGERDLWHRVDEFGGVSDFSDAFGISASKLYNWKNKDVFYPVDFVRRVMGENASDNVVAIKGGGRSLALSEPEFPLPESDEILTRVEASVSVNREGVPVYRSPEVSLVERFEQLLSELGEVPFSSYRRDGYELRYPKYLHEIFLEMDYDPVFPALVDEEGKVENGNLQVRGESVPVEDFEGDLYSREKRFQLALARGDDSTIKQMMAEEAANVSRAFR